MVWAALQQDPGLCFLKLGKGGVGKRWGNSSAVTVLFEKSHDTWESVITSEGLVPYHHLGTKVRLCSLLGKEAKSLWST